LNSPFDEATYKALLEGLEVSEISIKNVLADTETVRMDSEYYQKKYLQVEKYITNNSTYFSKLTDLGLIADGSAFYPALEPYYDMGDYPFIRVGDVKRFIDYASCVKVPFYILNNYPTLKHVHKGDIVLTKGGSIGFAGLIPRDCCVTRDLIFINSSILKEEDYICLFLFFASDFCYQQLIRSSSQTAQPHLTITLVKEIKVFNFSLNFKKTVTAIYKKVCELSDHSQSLYRQAESLLLQEIGLQDFAPSSEKCNIKSFKESFGATGRLDAEYYQRKYEEIEQILISYKNSFLTLGELCKTYRGNFISENFYTDDCNKYAYVRGADISSNILTDDKLIYLNKNFIRTNENLTKKGYVIIALIGSVGTAALITDKYVGSIVSNNLGIVRINSTQIIPEYLHLLLTSDKVGKLLFSQQEMRTAQPKLSDKDIHKFPIPLIDDNIQQQIAALITESFRLREESERLLEQAKAAVEAAIENGENAAMVFSVNGQNSV
jgi:restriction endonuclease S subunit